jgi:hypothetical protein
MTDRSWQDERADVIAWLEAELRVHKITSRGHWLAMAAYNIARGAHIGASEQRPRPGEESQYEPYLGR